MVVQNNLEIETVTLFFDFWAVYLIIPVSALATIVVVGADLIAQLRGATSGKEVIL